MYKKSILKNSGKIVLVAALFVSFIASAVFAYNPSNNEIEAVYLVVTVEKTKTVQDINNAISNVNTLPEPDQAEVTFPVLPIVERPNNVYANDGTWIEIVPPVEGTYLHIDFEEGGKYYLRNGEYHIYGGMNINAGNVVLKGESKDGVVIYQHNPDADGIIVKDTSNVVVENLTIDTREYDACAAFVEANADNIVLYNCNIYAGSKIFGVNFAGAPTEQGTKTLIAYNANILDSNNMMIDNYIECSYIGDGVSFSLQKAGICIGNTVLGTRIAFYLCRNSYVINNKSIDSNSEGIFIIYPSDDNVIAGNEILNPTYSGIKGWGKSEHSEEIEIRGENIKIYNNSIKDSGFMGIVIEQLANSEICNNTIENTALLGFYLMRSENLTLKDNYIKNPAVGGFEGWSSSLVGGMLIDFGIVDCIIDNNKIVDTMNRSVFGIKEEYGSIIMNQNNRITNNIIDIKEDVSFGESVYSNKLVIYGTNSDVSFKKDLLYRLLKIWAAGITYNGDNLVR